MSEIPNERMHECKQNKEPTNQQAYRPRPTSASDVAIIVILQNTGMMIFFRTPGINFEERF